MSVVIEGKRFLDIRSACKFFGKRPMAVQELLKKGYTIEEAMRYAGGVDGSRTEVPKKKKQRTENKSKLNLKNMDIIVDGVLYKNLREACQHYDTSYSKVWSRLDRGFTLDEAFGVVYREIRPCGNARGEEVTVGSLVFPSLAKACEHFGVNYKNVYRKVKNGLSAEKAIESLSLKTI